MLPRICQGLEPLTAKVRSEAQDTKIEEVLRRKPCGSGKHLWVQVKHGEISTRQVVAALARSVQVDPQQVSFAGVRDRFAEVRQWFSLPADAVEHPAALRNAGYKKLLRVQKLESHTHPITPADVIRLSYDIRLREAVADNGLIKARALLDKLRREGCPNYIGFVRMGPKGQHSKWGKMLWQGKHLPKRVQASRSEQGRYLGAYQAMLCNRYIAYRLQQDAFTSCLQGDVMQCQLAKSADERSYEIANDQAAMQRRMDSWEAVPCAPLFGKDLIAATDAALACEQAFAADIGVDLVPPAHVNGSRRGIRFQPLKVACEDQRKDLLIHCEMDPDVYLSSLLEELIQPERHII